MENIEDLLLSGGVQVNEKVAAGDEIEPRKGRIFQHVMVGEEHLFADFFAHPVTALIQGKESAQALRGNVRLDRARIKPVARIGDRLLIHVGGENLDFGRLIDPLGMLAEEDSNRIGFLSGRATGDPDPDLIVGFFAREELRNVRLERRKRLPVTKKMSHADEQILEQRAALGGMLSEEIEILRNALERVDLETARDPAQDGGAFILREIVPGLGSQIGQHFAKRLFVLGVVSFLRDRLSAGRVLILQVRLFRTGNLGR